MTEYDGDGGIIEMGWGSTNRNHYDITFKGQHPPADAPFVLGNTNYQDSVVTGTLSINATNDDFFTTDFKIDSKVPLEIKFLGIADIAASSTNDTDTSFTFDAGKHVLQFSGKIISEFEK